MNCKDFESVVNDIARGAVIEAGLRNSALAHAESCPNCAARLADERALTEGLRALVISNVRLEAPASAEAALLSAFREQMSARRAPASPFSRPAVSGRLRWYAGAAVAAAVLLFAVTVLTPRLMRTNEQQKVDLEAKASPSAFSPAPAQAVEPSEVENIPDARGVVTPAYVRPMRGALMQDASGYTRRMRRGNGPITDTPVRGTEVPDSSVEEMTDFIPLTYEAGFAPLDRGRIVRVELSRSALASLGLPVNMDRGNERVKADVVLGEDGLARAIRFVR